MKSEEGGGGTIALRFGLLDRREIHVPHDHNLALDAFDAFSWNNQFRLQFDVTIYFVNFLFFCSLFQFKREHVLSRIENFHSGRRVKYGEERKGRVERKEEKRRISLNLSYLKVRTA